MDFIGPQTKTSLAVMVGAVLLALGSGWGAATLFGHGAVSDATLRTTVRRLETATQGLATRASVDAALLNLEKRIDTNSDELAARGEWMDGQIEITTRLVALQEAQDSAEVRSAAAWQALEARVSRIETSIMEN